MWIKNIVTFLGKQPFTLSAAELDEVLDANRCQPCGSQTPRTEGFVPPLKGQSQMVYAADGFLYFTYQETARLLPGPVIRELLDEKVAHIEEEEGRKVSRKEKAEIKEQLTFELMPRAFTRSRRTSVLFDSERNRWLVDVSSANRAEEVMACLRKALGSLPLAYPAANTAPHSRYSHWLQERGSVPEGYTLGDRCELKGVKDEGAAVRFTAVDLGQAEILAHLDTGMVVTRLNLAWQDALELDVNDSLEIKRVRPLDVLRENLDALDADDAVAELQAQISLQGNTLRDALDALYEEFAVSAGDEADSEN